jgi:hypothetical protein
VLQAADQLKPLNMTRVVEADPAFSLRRRKNAHGVVLPDGPDRETGQPGEVVDGHRLIGLRR